MTPKAKAQELVDRYVQAYPMESTDQLSFRQAKKCALIAVDEIVKSHTYGLSTELKNYWQEVKQEIEKL